MNKKVTVILPCHNEEKILSHAIKSLLRQSYWDMEIIVLLDNCTDNSEEIVNSFYDVKVFKTVNNNGKRAGALNQLFNYYLEYSGEYIVIMDADTKLQYDGIDKAVKFLNKNIEYASVCSNAGIIKPKSTNLLWNMQNIEYGKFDCERIETNGFIMVSHGMCSIFRKSVLQDILCERYYIYDESNIIEDYELTMAIKHLNKGYKIGFDKKIKAYTDVPIKFNDFIRQRIRWNYGGVYTLLQYGITKYTIRDFLKHFMFIILTIINVILLSSIIIYGGMLGTGFYILLLFGIFNSLIRTKYISHKDKINYLLILLIIPELIYNAIHSFTLIYCYIANLLKLKIKW